MEIKNPMIYSVSQKTFSEDTLLYNSLKTLNLHMEAYFVLENEDPLPVVYNQAIEMAKKKNSDCLILVHDDVILEENPLPKLEKLFDSYDLVGVAGTSKIELKSPALWHLMGGGFNGGLLHGRVNHIVNEVGSEYGKKHPSYFGNYPHRVVMIDGVFMALNRKTIETAILDEQNPAKFHFYDLDFSLGCHMMGLKVGVGDVNITHASPGLSEFTEEWLNGEKWFLKKYEN